jgi:hypothetical protein
MFVVFVRLYWFEKRFQHLAEEARKSRGLRSRTETETKDRRDVGEEERGVSGRSIVVMHRNGGENQNGPADHGTHALVKRGESTPPTANGDGCYPEIDGPNVESSEPDLQFHRTQIAFADEVRWDGGQGGALKPPSRLNREDHNALPEKQRNTEGDQTLRIPGPREAEQGMTPQAVDTCGDGAPLADRITTADRGADDLEPSDRYITIDESEHSQSLAVKRSLSTLKLRRGKASQPEKIDEHNIPTARTRGRTFSFSSIRSTQTKDEDMPYLSWQPTVGRNSMFVNLTEEQREELGGIEYRALKTLASILICRPRYLVPLHFVLC